MRSEVLLRAIGQIEEERLEKSEKSVVRSKGTISKAILIAALISGLAITATAVGILFGWVDLRKERIGISVDEQIVESYNYDVLSIYAEFPVNGEVPTRIENFYLPAILSSDSLCEFMVSENGDDIYSFTLSWQPEDFEMFEYIQFEQRIATGYHPDEAIDKITYFPSNITYQTEIVTWEEFSGFLFSSEQWNDSDTCTNRLYWTDSKYLFRLVYPNWLNREDVQKIVQSLSAVDDIKPYFVIADRNASTLRTEAWTSFVEGYSGGSTYTFQAAVDRGWIEKSAYGVIVYADMNVENKVAFLNNIVFPQKFSQNRISSFSPLWRNEGIYGYGISWETPEYGENTHVYFGQRTLNDYLDSNGRIDHIMSNWSLGEIAAEKWSYSGYEFYQVSYTGNGKEVEGRKYLYWTDGTYLFTLAVPCEMPNEEVVSIMESIAAS